MGQLANQKVVELFLKTKEKLKEKKEKKKAIFWDCDGTLVYNNESFKCSLMRSLQEFGYYVSEDVVKCFLREACSWNKPEEDHGDANGEEWWERLFSGMRVFGEGQGTSPTDAISVCNAFRKNVVSLFPPVSDMISRGKRFLNTQLQKREIRKYDIWSVIIRWRTMREV